jgi:2-C-methyl-D-erythritol 4-phosphate cytidylyltransferase
MDPAPTAAVLVAAGSSTRMGPATGGERKPFLELAGRTVLEHACAAFDTVPAVTALVIVAHAEDVERLERLSASSPALAKVSAVVPGGATRAESVRLGVRAAPPEAELIAVHDAARALIEPATIELAIATATAQDAALVAIPVRDTLKRSEDGERASETVAREGLWAAQTPQVFRADTLRELTARAEAEDFLPTDDAALWERWVGPVPLVQGEETNLKITTPADLAIAAAILAHRAEVAR